MTQHSLLKGPQKNISLIAAMDRNHLIGQDGCLPWHLPADLKHFKKITLGKPIIMGRKTFDSIGKALPGRRNIIISRQTDFAANACEIFTNFNDSLLLLKNEPEIMIIGGAQLFATALPLANKMYLTLIDAAFTGNIFFPNWNSNDWKIVSSQSHAQDAHNLYAYQFLELKRLYITRA